MNICKYQDIRIIMATISKKDIVEKIADITQAKKVVVRKIVQSFLDEITDELAKNNRLEFRDFGVFEVRTRPPRTAQNPKTLEKVQVEAKRTVKFKTGRLMKQKLEAVKE
jgi:integration host factor subunit beta